MFIDSRFRPLFLLALLCAATASAQQPGAAAQSSNSKISLDVVAAPKSGRPVAGLQQQDFTVLDNKTPQTITSFKAVTGREANLEVIIVIDAVNADPQIVSIARIQIDKFLRLEAGHLTYPTTLAIVTDKGIQLLGGFSNDGNELSATLDKDEVGLRELNRSSGYYGAAERLQISLNSLNQLVSTEAPHPGRKVMIWVSPGWPLLSGPNTDLDSKEQQQIFGNIVAVSTQLRQGRVTLYSVNPIGAGESVVRASYYQDFLKGVTKPGQVNLGNLGLPVLAIQSGGLALDFTNDVAGALQDCLADSVPYYEISLDASPAAKPDEYHQLEIKIAKPGLIARTRQGYYAQPSAQGH
jgi:VWFA-related protein